MRVAKWILLALLVVIVVGGLIVYFNLNRIVRRTIETHATDSLNLQTTLDSASLSLFGGKLSLDDLQIASPQGFTSPKMFTLGGVDVAVQYGQLRGDPVRITEITIRKPTLVVEQSGMKLNVQSVMDQPSKEGSSNGDGKRDAGEPIKLIIDHLHVNDASVIIRGFPGLEKEITVPVPSLDLDNIGNAEGNQNGAAIKEIVMQVITALAAKGTDLGNLSEQLKQQLNSQLQGVATKMSADFQKQVNEITSKLGLPGDLGKVIGDKSGKVDPGKAIEKGIGDILGNKKDDKKDPQKKPTTRD